MHNFLNILIGVFILSVISSGNCETFQHLPNIPYGPHPVQLLDLYISSNESIKITKLVLLLHGGAWVSGNKDHVAWMVPILQEAFPDFAIATLNYRLGTVISPGFPKQLEDIQLAISYLKSSFTTELSFALYGTSAGAHLSMLYSYWWDRDSRDVKVIVDHVGPVDFMDEAYCDNVIVRPVLSNLIGPYNCQEYPEKWNETSPIYYLTADAPPTIGFYGNEDLVVPNNQMTMLQEKMQGLGVPHEFVRYPGGHGEWEEEYEADMWSRIIPFLEKHF